MRKIKKILLGLSTIVLVLSLSSCKKKYYSKYYLMKAEAAEHLAYKPSETFTSDLTKFSAKLVSEEYKNNNSTLISPLSAYMTLAMCVESSAGETRQEILDCLDMSYDDVLTNTKLIYSMTNTELTRNGGMKTTNSIWMDEKLEFKKETLNSLSQNYNADIFAVDYYNRNAQANKAIKDYVHDKSKGLLNINPDFDRYTSFNLINTIYLKSLWLNGGKNLSVNSDYNNFIDYDGNQINTTFYQTEYRDSKPIETEIYTMAKAPIGNFNIHFILPNDGKTIDDILVPSELENIMNAEYVMKEKIDDVYYSYSTRIVFPQFKLESELDLTSSLKSLKINSLFDESSCNLSNIISDKDTYCKYVKQNNVLKIDKKGIEGASYTVANNGKTSIHVGKDKYDVIVDKSFVVLVTIGNIPIFVGAVKSL